MYHHVSHHQVVSVINAEYAQVDRDLKTARRDHQPPFRFTELLSTCSPYKGTSLIRNRLLLGPNSRAMPMVALGGGIFLWARYPCTGWEGGRTSLCWRTRQEASFRMNPLATHGVNETHNLSIYWRTREGVPHSAGRGGVSRSVNGTYNLLIRLSTWG